MCYILNRFKWNILCNINISVNRDVWFDVPHSQHKFLVTVNFDNTFENCEKVCNEKHSSFAPFLPEDMLTVMYGIQEIYHGCWVNNTDTGKCIRLFRDKQSSNVSFSRPKDCAGKGHCVCWNGTRDSHKPTYVPLQGPNSTQTTLLACSKAQDQTSTTSTTVKPTTATPSTSFQKGKTTVSTSDINETNPFTNMKAEALNNWTMYDLQELYINTNKTSHDNASRFCHDELNSTLVTVLNPLEYLRLLKTMGLKTGIFWIGK